MGEVGRGWGRMGDLNLSSTYRCALTVWLYPGSRGGGWGRMGDLNLSSTCRRALTVRLRLVRTKLCVYTAYD